jgi:type I restriction enzyme S subunit
MHELFTRGLSNEAQKETEIGLLPKSWKVESLGTHHNVGSGGTPSRSNNAYWNEGTIPWVKTTEVNYGVILETGEFITPEGLRNSAAKILPIGTLLMAMYGQGVTRAKVAILGIQAACNQACATINPKDSTIDPHYLFHFLTYRYEDIRRLAHGGQQQNLNLDIVRALFVSAPSSLDEQHEIVEILDSINLKIDLHKRKRAVFKDLFNLLLHELMKGEIRVADLDLSMLSIVKSSEAAA